MLLGVGLTMVFVAGCGDDGDDNDAVDTAGEADASADSGSTDDAETGETATGDSGSDSGDDDTGGTDDGDDSRAAAPPEAGAVVVVNGEEFTFDQEIVCVDMGGALGASFASSAAEIAFDVSLPPEDWESRVDEGWDPPSVRLDDDRLDMPVSWRAGDDVVDSMSGIPAEVVVTSFSVDGSSGDGTATVVDVNTVGVTDPVVSELAFEFSCG